MDKKRKWRFVPEGATKLQGGQYEGPRVGGVFRVWYVTGGDGVKFHRTPYAPRGWKVQKNRTSFGGKPVEYVVSNPADIEALDAFVGENPYQEFGGYSA